VEIKALQKITVRILSICLYKSYPNCVNYHNKAAVPEAKVLEPYND